MGITAIEAARIANAAGLSLSDAVALQQLSGTVADAEAFAAEFTGKAQLTREQLAGMDPAAILQAKENGQCDELLGRKS